jgi:formate dehydrogenase subunit gamma
MSRDESQLLPNGRVLRYTYKERLVHWLAAISYTYLLLTGLAFYTPWLFWLAVMLGGGTISRELHPWAGLIFSVAVVIMYGMWAFEMNVTENDRQWFRQVGHYISNEDEKTPPQDRFNAGQKSLFWGFAICMVLLLLSGLVLWFPNYIPWNLRWVRYLAVLIHPAAALITIGLFLIHLYMGLAIEEGALHSMVGGDVSESWAKEFHRVWYDRVLRRAPNATAGAGANPPARK